MHWRFVNVSALEHPLHLHGFYYRVDSRGDGARDSTFAPADRRLTVTELMLPGQTMSMTWAPTRSGNWIFHCHFASHIATEAALEADRADAESRARWSTTSTPGHDPLRHMSGLVLGIRVASRGEVRQASMTPARPIRLARAVAREGVRRLRRLLVRARRISGGSRRRFDARARPRAVARARTSRWPSTIVNRSHDQAAIHWHGIELESFPDGVPDWSGAGRTTLPMIAPHDSLTVRFTPPRAGTFIYHSHANEIAADLVGAVRRAAS